MTTEGLAVTMDLFIAFRAVRSKILVNRSYYTGNNNSLCTVLDSDNIFSYFTDKCWFI